MNKKLFLMIFMAFSITSLWADDGFTPIYPSIVPFETEKVKDDRYVTGYRYFSWIATERTHSSHQKLADTINNAFRLQKTLETRQKNGVSSLYAMLKGNQTGKKSKTQPLGNQFYNPLLSFEIARRNFVTQI